MTRIIKADGRLYMDAEEYISALIDRMDALSMEMAVFMDDWCMKDIYDTRYVLKGYAMATRVLTEEYMRYADEDRAEVFRGNLSQLDDIISSIE